MRHRGMNWGLLGLLALGAVATAAVLCSGRRSAAGHGGDWGAEPSAEPRDDVRPAGPKAMHDRPREGWSKVDEQGDESFPASDPPANY